MQKDPLETLVSEIKGSRKYRHVTESLVRRIGARELTHCRNLKEAIHATRNKLHQVGGAFVEFDMPYARWKNELEAAYKSGDRLAFLEACKRVMANHASTRERLVDIDRFYPMLFPHLGTIHAVQDLACGLNPLMLPWMQLADETAYYAYEIYEDMVDFLNFFFQLIGRRGSAAVIDLGQAAPPIEADVAFLLKTLPCLEQSEKNRSLPLLSSIQAGRVVVSFPCQSLGGRSKGMMQNYEQQFSRLIAASGWTVQRLDSSREMIFLVDKRAAPMQSLHEPGRDP